MRLILAAMLLLKMGATPLSKKLSMKDDGEKNFKLSQVYSSVFYGSEQNELKLMAEALRYLIKRR